MSWGVVTTSRCGHISTSEVHYFLIIQRIGLNYSLLNYSTSWKMAPNFLDKLGIHTRAVIGP